MTVKLAKRTDCVIALFRVEGTPELQVDGGFLVEVEGLRAAEGTLVRVLADAADALIAECLSTASLTDVGLFCDVVADGALVLFVLGSLLDEVLGFISPH